MKRLIKWIKSLFKKTKTNKPSASEDVFKKLVWCYGGVDGSKASLDGSASGCKISSASINVIKGITFKATGKMWGATHEKANARNCIFFKKADGKYYGGFWEWGSPDRSFRGFDNIFGSYKGWKGSEFKNANEFVFLVTNTAATARSNAIVVKR